MEATAVTALSAALGSVIGASASIVTTWIAQRTQTIREHLEWKLRERESLYKEFITEASRLAVDSLTHSLERPDQLAALYGILSRIRLVAADAGPAKTGRYLPSTLATTTPPPTSPPR